MNEQELRNLMFTAQDEELGPFVIRYPRGKGVMVDWKTDFKSIKIGTGRKLRSGKDIAILSLGHIGNYASEVCSEYDKKGFHIGHYDMRFAKPLDHKILHEVFQQYTHVITIEDGCISGGMGSSILEFMADNQYNSLVYRLGIPDNFIEHGPQKQLHDICGYSPDKIKAKVEQIKSELNLAV
jgi:1-deoxy-D-xylulose-5-phosphate synthase